MIIKCRLKVTKRERYMTFVIKPVENAKVPTNPFE